MRDNASIAVSKLISDVSATNESIVEVGYNVLISSKIALITSLTFPSET